MARIKRNPNADILELGADEDLKELFSLIFETSLQGKMKSHLSRESNDKGFI